MLWTFQGFQGLKKGNVGELWGGGGGGGSARRMVVAHVALSNPT